MPSSGEKKRLKARAVPTSFGRELKAARLERNFTLKDLSERSGVSITYLSDLERGTLENPTLKALTAISGALDLSPNELLGLDQNGGRSPRPPLPKALAEFSQSEQFRSAMDEEASQRRVDADSLSEDWLEALRGIAVR